MSNLIDNLIAKARDLSDKKSITLSTIGNYMANDGDVFNRLLEGGDCYTGTYEKYDAWLEAQLKEAGE